MQGRSHQRLTVSDTCGSARLTLRYRTKARECIRGLRDTRSPRTRSPRDAAQAAVHFSVPMSVFSRIRRWFAGPVVDPATQREADSVKERKELAGLSQDTPTNFSGTVTPDRTPKPK